MAFIDSDPQLFDAQAIDLTPETVPLEVTIVNAVRNGLLKTRLAFPAAVVAVVGDQTVDLQPLFMTRYPGEPATELKQLRSVPVVMPQGGDYRISFPVAVGDTGLAIVADRNLDTWLAGNGGPADPADARAHHIADSIFVPGLVPTGKQTADTGTDLVIANGAMKIRAKKNGHLTLQNANFEVIDVLAQGLQCFIDTLKALEQAQVLTAFGPAPFLATTIGALTQLQTKAQGILGNLNTFKG